MREIKLSDTPDVSFKISFEGDDIECRLKYLSIVQQWTISVTYKQKKMIGLKVSCGVLMLKQFNLPFDILFRNNTGSGIDPYLINDFSSGRYTMIVLDRDDVNVLRGYEVE